MKRLKHSRKTHRYIERIAEQYLLSTRGKPVVAAVILSREQIEEILEYIRCAAMDYELDHHVRLYPKMYHGSPHLWCRQCGYFLTLQVEDAYLELVEKRPLREEKQSPRS